MDVSAVGLQSAPETLARGSVLRDTYKITDVLSRTALGVTYLAQDLRTRNLCAVTGNYPQGLAARTSSGLAAQPGYEAAYSQQLPGILGGVTIAGAVSAPQYRRRHGSIHSWRHGLPRSELRTGPDLTSWLAGLEASPPIELRSISLLFGPLCDALALMHCARRDPR